MAAEKRKNTTIVIKRIAAPEGAAHHGGAWKVAYADFVTAMMAFFLLMWLLNATTEQQRQGLADYFNPTIVRTLSGQGGAKTESGNAETMAVTEATDALLALNDHIQDVLAGIGAESMQKANLLRHVVTRLSDEGLVIELSDLSDEPLFVDDTAQPAPILPALIEVLARVMGITKNDIAITGHVRAFPEVLLHSPVWDLSNDRAHIVRQLLEKSAFSAMRIQRVTGYADRRSRTSDPMNVKNNRIEIILLR